MEQDCVKLVEALLPFTGQGGVVELDSKLVDSCVSELKDKQQMAKDLEQARDEASMKPSVARKLNEKIRGLEAELEQLRTNKKVKELEKKVTFLEHELKQSYTTKNFTLKSGLLELEKQYRAHMNVDPAMAAFWADVTVLLDEKKDKDAPAQFRGPPTRASTSGSGSRTSSAGGTTAARTDAAGAAAAGSGGGGGGSSAAAAGSDAGVSGSAGGGAGTASSSASSDADAAAGSKRQQLQSHPPSGVQLQVEAFNSIISDEAASAATALPTQDSQGEAKQQLRAQPPAAAAAAAAAAAESSVVEESLQPVRVVKDDYRRKVKDVAFQPLPAALSRAAAAGSAEAAAAEQAAEPEAAAAAAAAAAAGLPAPVDAAALERGVDALCASIRGLQAAFSRASSGGAALQLPAPPLLPEHLRSSAGGDGQQQQQQQGQEVDTSSLWQQQIEQLLAAAQQLKAAAAAGMPAGQQQQQQDTAGLMAYVLQLREALAAGSIGKQATDGAGAGDAPAPGIDVQLAAVQQQMQQLQQLQQQASREAGSQVLLVNVFGEFISQLEQQGLIDGTTTPAAAAAAGKGGEQHMLLELLQQFLAVNPQVPQLLAAQLAPAAAAAAPAVAAVGVQQSPDTSHVSTQAEAAAAAHAETQSEPLPLPSVHAEVQAELAAETTHASTQAEQETSHAEVQAELAAETSHASTQAELAAETSHASTQAEQETSHAEVQAELAAETSHASTQAEPPSPGSHISTQTSQVESAAAATQHSPPDSPLHAAVQATPQPPELTHVASQTELQAGLAAGGEATSGSDQQQQQQRQDDAGAAGLAMPPAPRPSTLTDEELQAGSGIIYAGSGGELPVSKVAVGQQLDILQQLSRRTASQGSTGQLSEAAAVAGAGAGGGTQAGSAGPAAGSGVSGLMLSDSGLSGAAASDAGAELVSAVVDVTPEQLTDLQSVAQELGQLRADNLELAASLQVTKSLVDHLNNGMKTAVDKADDAEADAAHTRHQLEAAHASLKQLQAEQSELTGLLIEAKVEIAERRGELVKLVRNLRRAVEQPTTTAGVVKELRDILAVVPTDSSDPPSPRAPGAAPAAAAAGPGRTGSLDLAAGRQALAGLAAGLGSTLSNMRTASLGMRNSGDMAAAAAAAAAAPADKAPAAPEANGNSV